MAATQIDVGAATLTVDDTGGGGKPIVLIHGWLGDHRTWSGLAPALSPTHRVVALDLRGHGTSSVPAHGFADVDMAADIVALIRRLELGPAVLMGHSLGTTVATRVAVDAPELVTALVLIDPDYGGDPAHRPDLAALANRREDETVKDGVAGLFRTRLDAATRSADLRARHLDAVLATPAKVVAESLRAFIDTPTSIRFRPQAEALLPARRQPVLSFHGVAARAEWERRQATHPLSVAVVVPGAGHWIQEEYPGLVLDHVTRWLGSIETRQARDEPMADGRRTGR